MYYWRVYSINDAGNSAWSTVFSFFTGRTSVLASHPQNANQTLFINGNTVNYSLETPCQMTVKYYSLDGRCALSLIDSHQKAGKYSFIIPRDKLPAGTYFQAFKAGNISQMDKVVIMR